MTGAAGFIGYHLAQQLRSVSAERPTVVGVDNFNSYYDITLKRDRAARLFALGVTLHYASVCDVTYMRHLFAAHRFTHVVHFAGEAGVRHSGEAPNAFVEANIGCFAELLDILKENRVRKCCKLLCLKLYMCSSYRRAVNKSLNIFIEQNFLFPPLPLCAEPQGVHLVYASSSSVYGPASPVPFSVTHTQRYPGNMYALTKMTNEASTECGLPPPTPHRTTPHYTTPHYTTLHYTTLHYTAPHYTTPHHTTPHYTTPHYTTLHHTTLHHTTPHYTTLHYTTSHHTTLHCTTLHHATPYNTTQHNTTSHTPHHTHHHTTSHHHTTHTTTPHNLTHTTTPHHTHHHTPPPHNTPHTTPHHTTSHTPPHHTTHNTTQHHTTHNTTHHHTTPHTPPHTTTPHTPPHHTHHHTTTSHRPPHHTQHHTTQHHTTQHHITQTTTPHQIALLIVCFTKSLYPFLGWGGGGAVMTKAG